MRIWGLLAVIAALSACGPAAENAAPDGDGANLNGLPTVRTPYEAVYQMAEEEGSREATMYVASWRKLRFEMAHPDAARAAAGQKIVGVFDEGQGRSLMFVEGPDAPPVAMAMPQEQDFMRDLTSWSGEDGAPPRKVGTDRVAGLACDVWEIAPATQGEAAAQACITGDGIFLRGGDAGAEPTMIATSVKKGPIDAAKFAVPQGLEVLDMGPCSNAMEEAMAAAQAGKQPDMAAMAKCQAVAEKAGALFGD